MSIVDNCFPNLTTTKDLIDSYRVNPSDQGTLAVQEDVGSTFMILRNYIANEALIFLHTFELNKGRFLSDETM
jgi:hypothetical protein